MMETADLQMLVYKVFRTLGFRAIARIVLMAGGEALEIAAGRLGLIAWLGGR